MRLRVTAAFTLLIALMVDVALAQERAIPRDALRSGLEYTGPDVRAMQADDAANPAMLWVERGAELFRAAPAAGAPSCSACHAEPAMRGVAAHYPAFDAKAARVIDLDDRIDACRVDRQRQTPLPRGSEDLIALTAFVANASRGLPLHVQVTGSAQASFERGRAFYYSRRGQMNLSCANCHEQNYGKHLLTETISQGHGNAYPAYRLEWQAAGSLQRRLRACLFGIRAAVPPEGAP
jgi:L-cysteine S-thiosulfotransferase